MKKLFGVLLFFLMAGSALAGWFFGHKMIEEKKDALITEVSGSLKTQSGMTFVSADRDRSVVECTVNYEVTEIDLTGVYLEDGSIAFYYDEERTRIASGMQPLSEGTNVYYLLAKQKVTLYRFIPYEITLQYTLRITRKSLEDDAEHTHIFGNLIEVVPATCTDTGMAAHYRCSLCGKLFDQSKREKREVDLVLAVDPDAHSWNESDRCIFCGTHKTTEGLSYVYEASSNSYALSGYPGTETEIYLPSEYEGKPVTAIRPFAFRGLSALTSVVVPDSVTTIGAGAFSGCSSLEEVTLPFVGGRRDADSASESTLFGYIFGAESYEGGVAVVQYYGATSFATYYIPASLRTVKISDGNIFYGAFYGCAKLTSVTLPSAVTSIGDDAFYGCSELTTLAVPATVTTIGEEAFMKCAALRSVSFSGNDLRIIGRQAFADCGALTSIMIPSGVTSLGESVFSKCASLREMAIPFVGNVARATAGGKQYPFGYIFGTTSYGGAKGVSQGSGSEITVYYIPTSLRSVTVTGGEIPNGAFASCSTLFSVSLGEGVTSIGDSAFKDCAALTSVKIPSTVESVGTEAFSGCSELNYNKYDNALYLGDDEDPYRILVKADSSAIESCEIFRKTKIICEKAFSGCSSMSSVSLGADVTTIGAEAFRGCSALGTISYAGTKLLWGAILKGSDWDKDSGEYVVRCQDGNVDKKSTTSTPTWSQLIGKATDANNGSNVSLY
ncbi:MAG: leucine-rich repeat domain-containing protein [Clostridia bacterium]|nr:leucine-rich repeat domain-containing protein [Clostridia bacterium]